MILRPYQEQAIADLKQGALAGHIRQMLSMPTGSGKTVTGAEICRRAHAKGKRTLWIVDRIELVAQAVATLHRFGLQVGVLQAANTDIQPTDDVVVGSIQTIAARHAPIADLIVIDEAHILHKGHKALMDTWNAVTVIGLSATPLQQGLGKYFSHLVRGPSIAALIADGALVPARAFCPSHAAMEQILASVRTRRGDFIEGELSKAINCKELVGDIVATWQDKAAERLTLVFAVDIAHSKAITDDFIAAGVRSAHIDAYTPGEQRRAIIDRFRAGDIRVLSSVNVLGIGFDAPEASCGILARPTLSETLHMQQLGRLIRPADGKTDALLLDHAGNTLRFGLPVDFEVPDLDSGEHRSTRQKRKLAKMVACSECGFALEPDQRICPDCGVDRPVRQSKVTYVDGRLVELGSDDDGANTYSAADKRQWYRALVWCYARQGRRDPHGRAFYAFRDKFGEGSPWSWRELEPVAPTAEQARWATHYAIKSAARWRKKAQAEQKHQAPCPACGSAKYTVTEGKGPHAAGKRCAECGQHLGWLSKRAAAALREGPTP